MPCRQDSRTPDWRLASIGIGSGVGDQLPTARYADASAGKHHGLVQLRTLRHIGDAHRNHRDAPRRRIVSTTMDLATGAWHGAMTLADATAELNSAGLKVVVTNAYEWSRGRRERSSTANSSSRSKATIHVRKVMLGALEP